MTKVITIPVLFLAWALGVILVLSSILTSVLAISMVM